MANTSNRGDAPMGQARQQADEAMGHLQQAGNEARQAASAAASGLGQKAQETAANLADKAREKASNLSQRTGDLARKAEDRADDALASMGQRITSMGGSIRQAAPRSGVVGSAAGAVAERLENSGRYLQEHGVSEITDDVASTVRRHPLPALGLAFGVGILIGMLARR